MADVVYGDIAVTGTSSSAANTIWPASGELAPFCGTIEVFNNGNVDAFINCYPLHAPNSWYAIAPGQAKILQTRDKQGATNVRAYAASSCNLRVLPISA